MTPVSGRVSPGREIHERYPGWLPDDPALRDGPTSHEVRRPPGWESDEHLCDRALAALARLAARHRRR